MLLISHTPSEPLSSYVESILFVSGNNKGTGLPKTAMSMVFNLGDSFKLYDDDSFTTCIDYKKYWLSGFQLQPRHVECYGRSEMIVIQFKSIGALAFLKEPLHYFTDNYISLDAIYGRKASDAWNRLRGVTTVNERFLIVENFLYQCLLTNLLPDVAIINSANDLLRNSNQSITDVCEVLDTSRKHMNFLFKEYIGVSPKTLSLLYRFQDSIQILSQSNPKRLTTFAHEMEYFDQAHFSNGFKKFAGITPSDYIRLKDRIPTLEKVPHYLPKLG